MRYALIGCGRISPNHIMAAKNNNLEMVAICDIDTKCMEDKVKKFELPESVKLYTDYKELLAVEKPELVAVTTESGLHANIAIDCINAGCHVIIEKPIALSIKDADAIIAAAKEKGVKVCVNHQNRFNKSIQKIREAVEKGRFGRMFHGTAHIRWARDWEYYSRAKWRGTWAQDGGCLMNQCIHNIDLLIWMMGGEPVEVMAYTDRMKHDYIEAEDLGMGIVKFANGTYGIIEGTTKDPAFASVAPIVIALGHTLDEYYGITKDDSKEVTIYSLMQSSYEAQLREKDIINEWSLKEKNAIIAN